MKIYTSLAIGAALVAASTVASADELSGGMQVPIQLTDQQMEDVTAGKKRYGKKYRGKKRHCYYCSGLADSNSDAHAYGGYSNVATTWNYANATPYSAHASGSAFAYAGP